MNIISKIVAVALLALTFSLAASASADPGYGGAFTKKNYKIRGAWSIVHTEEGRFLELNQQFKTRNAPDLKLFLSRLPASELDNDNAVADGVLIAPLKSNKGAQRYLLPASLDLDEFQSLIIHCEAFSKLWGVSALGTR